ncbi:MAG: DNA repair protein [Rhodobacteraceae bacterium]|nr:DNA repair protein [Paracoccaceae bacterium]
MNTSLRATGQLVQYLMQRIAFLMVLTLGLGLSAYAVAAALGVVPWLVMPLQFGDTAPIEAGMAVQLGITALAFCLMFFLPANSRMMALETSHRRFHMGMRDVARAYSAAHRADREGVFTMPSEFDSVRERIAFLRDHPDLGDLEPSVLEVAAQMSHVSQELAQVYSDRNVARARDFLIARQQEVEDFNIRLEEAKRVANEMHSWHTRLSLEEDVAESQLARLCEVLETILPELTLAPDPAPAHAHAEAQDVSAPLVLRNDAHGSGWVGGPAHAGAGIEDQRIVAMVSRRAAE